MPGTSRNRFLPDHARRPEALNARPTQQMCFVANIASTSLNPMRVRPGALHQHLPPAFDASIRTEEAILAEVCWHRAAPSARHKDTRPWSLPTLNVAGLRARRSRSTAHPGPCMPQKTPEAIGSRTETLSCLDLSPEGQFAPTQRPACRTRRRSRRGYNGTW